MIGQWPLSQGRTFRFYERDFAKMMISYSGLTKLKTKPIVYQNILIARDSGTLEWMKELSSKRRAIEEFINSSSNVTDSIPREMSGGLTSRFEQNIQKLEQYLPLLENLIYHINEKFKNHQTIIRWISDMKIRWSSALSSSSVFHLKGAKFYQVNDMHFELGMILSLYGATLRERALQLSSSDLVQAAILFRQAAGVYDFLAREVLVHSSWSEDKPSEATSRMACVMSLICLAEAQAVTARKAEEKGSTCGLLAKLHHGITEFLVEATNMLLATTKESKDVSSSLMDYISSCKTLHESKSYQYTAKGLKNDGKLGAAVGVARQALSNLKKNMPKEESSRSVFRQVMDDLSVMIRKYEHENDFVWNDKVPCRYEFPSPQAVEIVSPIAYQPQKWERSLAFKW